MQNNEAPNPEETTRLIPEIILPTLVECATHLREQVISLNTANEELTQARTTLMTEIAEANQREVDAANRANDELFMFNQMVATIRQRDNTIMKMYNQVRKLGKRLGVKPQSQPEPDEETRKITKAIANKFLKANQKVKGHEDRFDKMMAEIQNCIIDLRSQVRRGEHITEEDLRQLMDKLNVHTKSQVIFPSSKRALNPKK